MKRVLITATMVAVLLFTFTVAAYGGSTGTPGQPGQTCGNPNALTTPGQAANAPGSAFNPGGVAGGVYAGTQPQNSSNPHSVSQYDVACVQVSQSHP
jgi:hypothetical protein